MAHDNSNARRTSKAPLREVHVSEQVLHSCFRHAFTTEKEEVMGLLLGCIEVRPFPPLEGDSHADAHERAKKTGSIVKSGSTSKSTAATSSPSPPPPQQQQPSQQPSAEWGEGKVAFIWATHVCERNVRRSDRVEVSPEALVAASDTAERVTVETGVGTRVLGWYHSHPKIPVVPSAVDLRTQSTFQQHVESGWVGLIVSLFNTEANWNRHHCALQCFQAGSHEEHIEVPVLVVPATDVFPASVPLAKPLTALMDTTPSLLRVLRQEMKNGVASVEEKSGHNPAAMRAARGLADVQMFEVDRLLAEPTRKELEACSLPVLRAEVARLEKELAAPAAGTSTPHEK